MSYFLGRLGTIVARLGKFQLGVAFVTAGDVPSEQFTVPASTVAFAAPAWTATFVVPASTVTFAS